MNESRQLKNTEEVLSYLRYIRNKKQEYFICLSVDSGGRFIRRRVVSIGTLTAALVHPREVFAGPIKDRAASIIIAHNHPSGDVCPSGADISTTQQLVASGQLLGIQLQDHFIVSKTEYFSFRNRQLII